MTQQSPPFSQRLRASTATMHRDTSRNAYLRALMRGELDLTGYAMLVVQHREIYAALEALSDHFAGESVAGEFVFPELSRRQALADDLAHLRSCGVVLPQPTAATRRYVERLAELASWPAGYVAHHYVRYLGDLSGGTTVGRAIARSYGIPFGAAGSSFYHFARIASPDEFKAGYRSRLDAAPWSEREQQQFLAEVRLGYEFNAEVLDELAAQVLTPRAAS